MATASRDGNRVPTLLGVSSIDSSTPTSAQINPTTGRLLVDSTISSGFGIAGYDYVTLTQNSTQDIWVFKTGGSGGTTVATITITYTDSGKGTISTVAKT